MCVGIDRIYHQHVQVVTQYSNQMCFCDILSRSICPYTSSVLSLFLFFLFLSLHILQSFPIHIRSIYSSSSQSTPVHSVSVMARRPRYYVYARMSGRPSQPRLSCHPYAPSPVDTFERNKKTAIQQRKLIHIHMYLY